MANIIKQTIKFTSFVVMILCMGSKDSNKLQGIKSVVNDQEHTNVSEKMSAISKMDVNALKTDVDAQAMLGEAQFHRMICELSDSAKQSEKTQAKSIIESQNQTGSDQHAGVGPRSALLQDQQPLLPTHTAVSSSNTLGDLGQSDAAKLDPSELWVSDLLQYADYLKQKYLHNTQDAAPNNSADYPSGFEPYTYC